MRKLLNKPWFVGVLALVALLLAGRMTLSKPAAAPSDAVDPAPPNETAGAAAPEPEVPRSIAAALLALPAAAPARDPFATRLPPPSPLPEVVDTAHLSALWTENGATLALVNNVILRAGDTVGQIKIESATQEGVWVSHGSDRHFLPLGATFVLRTRGGRDVL